MARKQVDMAKGLGSNLQALDPNTGEVLKGAMVFVPEQRKSPFGKDWFAVAQSALNFLAQNRKYLGEEGFAVFCALASKLDFQNYILINQSEMARDMGMDRGNLNKAIKRLETLGILIRGPKSGISPTFRLNPNVGWKGKGKAHFGALQEARANGWKLIKGGKKAKDLTTDLPAS